MSLDQWSVTNPLDRVYGMLGVLGEKIQVDYALSAAAVFASFAMKLLKTDKSLWMFDLAANHPMRDLPSWCLDMDAPSKTTPLGPLMDSHGTYYSTSKRVGSKNQYRVESDEAAKTLHITGFQVDVCRPHCAICDLHDLFNDVQINRFIRHPQVDKRVNKLISKRVRRGGHCPWSLFSDSSCR